MQNQLHQVLAPKDFDIVQVKNKSSGAFEYRAPASQGGQSNGL